MFIVNPFVYGAGAVRYFVADFENEALQTGINFLTSGYYRRYGGGMFYSGTGYFIDLWHTIFYDAFEAYQTGTISLLTSGVTGGRIEITGGTTGYFSYFPQIYWHDAFEVYSTGFITGLNQGFYMSGASTATGGYFVSGDLTP